MRLSSAPVSRRALLCGGAALAASAALPAQAFRPSSRWLLDRAMAVQLARKVNTLHVLSDVTLYDIPGQPRLVTTQNLWMLAPYALRIEIDLGERKELLLRTRKKTLRETLAGKTKQKTRPHFLYDFLTTGADYSRANAGVRLRAGMKAMGVASDVVTYSRFDGRVMYLIGSKSWETDKSQVWLDKDTLHLARVVEMKTGPDGKKVRHDTRLLGYGSPEGGSWFPHAVEHWQDDKLLRRAVTRQVEKNARLDGALFQID